MNAQNRKRACLNGWSLQSKCQINFKIIVAVQVFSLSLKREIWLCRILLMVKENSSTGLTSENHSNRIQIIFTEIVYLCMYVLNLIKFTSQIHEWIWVSRHSILAAFHPYLNDINKGKVCFVDFWHTIYVIHAHTVYPILMRR